MTVWRWDGLLREHGVAGLVPARRGPKGPGKLSPELAGRIRELDAAGLALARIAAGCGVSTFTVRAALGRVAARGACPAQDAGQDDEPAAAQPDEKTEPEPAAEGETELGPLPVLPGPAGREGERALARFGLLGESAAPVFVPGARYPLAGLLLALPALEAAGLLACARQVYGRLRNGFYGPAVTLLMLVFLALLREPGAEGATRIGIAAVGRVLGLDRAPQVKTVRRKLSGLAGRGRAAELQLAAAAHHAAARPDDLGFFYIDGHTRAYFGTRDVQAGHVARLVVPRPGHRGDLGHRPARRPAAGGDRRAVRLFGRPDPRPAPRAAPHRRPGSQAHVVL